MKAEISEKINQGIHKRSANPKAAENCLDPDWQAGYFIGSLQERIPELWEDDHPITVEWRWRGARNKPTKAFKSWKQGYWAGVFNHL